MANLWSSLLQILPLVTPLSSSPSAVSPSDAATAITHPSPGLPMVINTWGGPFTIATDAAYESLLASSSSSGGSSSNNKSTNKTTRATAVAALDAVQLGCAACEAAQCDGSVGFGGSPDEQCETTLDALLMDGATLKTGAVAALRRVRDAVGVARAVLDHTSHSLLAGDLATAFAVENGFVEEAGGIGTADSARACREWRERDKCQPNYRLDVTPDPKTACGPYTPVSATLAEDNSPAQKKRYQVSHDTISMIALDGAGGMAAGTSTNGASHKVPGRVGDGPIAGSGSYVDGEVGGCGATGDGDIMMRFLPCYQAVESMRRGLTPGEAAEDAGEHAGAASGWTFTYAFRGGGMEGTQVVTMPPIDGAEDSVVEI
ncbi:N(4)-(beta-N-acetylglucosaminyl)-L-asparaginase [Apiospora rasikravindrae]|uniref:N(4)-(Beta-N-acetylglucosaminyl)-L-asparaginase n=1 Tax=Apiospora rasikravindrae TaxID=990691 RepID=A0ABR1UB96_9PEZI